MSLHPAGWRRVLSLLPLGQDAAVSALRRLGFWEAARRLEDPISLESGAALRASGSLVTAACRGYPQSWLLERSGAPPVLWASSAVPACRWVAVVGSRDPLPEHRAAVKSIVQWASSRGFGVISGGARGVDSCAAEAAHAAGVPCIEVLPFGLASDSAISPSSSRLSCFAPDAEFTALRAMERNRLIYSAACLAVVFHPRFQVGGSWHGAVAAIRGRLCPVAVWAAPIGEASRALGCLGASLVSSASALDALLDAPVQTTLFDSLPSAS